ncbi:MAG TPA: hypothetical protein VE224_01655 [Pseudolabrys sp.]|jgi:hypothetical protein|nr:hypothetical protein [Pseudolabrys sp.]
MPDDSSTSFRRAAPWILVGILVAICAAVGVIAWAGGWGFSSSRVASPNPAPAPGTLPRSTPARHMDVKPPVH